MLVRVTIGNNVILQAHVLWVLGLGPTSSNAERLNGCMLSVFSSLCSNLSYFIDTYRHGKTCYISDMMRVPYGTLFI